MIQWFSDSDSGIDKYNIVFSVNQNDYDNRCHYIIDSTVFLSLQVDGCSHM